MQIYRAPGPYLRLPDIRTSFQRQNTKTWNGFKYAHVSARNTISYVGS